MNPANPLSVLTPRELEVVEKIWAGCLDKQGADNLGISANTFRAHLKAVKAKLGVNNRVAVALLFERSRVTKNS